MPRRELPRNTRRAHLAARVGHRVAERRSLSGVAESPTPPPTVATVEVRVVEQPASAREPRQRMPLFAFVLLGILSFFGVKRGLDHAELVLPTTDELVTMVQASLAQSGTRATGASLLDGLVRDTKPKEPEGDRVKLRREGHVSVPGGILVLPESFQPRTDGQYDLLIHFHGNTAVVRESAEVAHLDAAVAIINLGIGSAPYEEYYAVPGTYEELLESIRVGLERRGLAGGRLRRVALSGWSAGYGAISTILQVRRKESSIDAVLVLDGIHCGWENGELNHRQMKPFATVAEQAAKGQMLFSITHSEIDPVTYASTSATADYLIASAGASRSPSDPQRDTPLYLELESMKGAVSKKLEKQMVPTSEARRGLFHVRGYRGETKEHHMAHLFQMGATLLPELVARWTR